MHPFFAINNGPLHYALSQMGRGKSQRVHKERIFFRTHAHQPLRTRRRRHPDPRPYKRRGHSDDGLRGMDLLRGVYTLTQVRAKVMSKCNDPINNSGDCSNVDPCIESSKHYKIILEGGFKEQ